MAAAFEVTVGGTRGDEWEKICGTRTFPIKSSMTVIAKVPGEAAAVEVFMMDPDSVDPPVLEKIVAHLRARFGFQWDEEIRREISRGIPIAADGCTVALRDPQHWI